MKVFDGYSCYVSFVAGNCYIGNRGFAIFAGINPKSELRWIDIDSDSWSFDFVS